MWVSRAAYPVAEPVQLILPPGSDSARRLAVGDAPQDDSPLLRLQVGREGVARIGYRAPYLPLDLPVLYTEARIRPACTGRRQSLINHSGQACAS